MKTPILIRSYFKDAQWVRYTLRSIRKYAKDFAYTVLVTPTRDHAVFEPLIKEFGCRWHEYVVREDKPMIHGIVMVCRADEICPDADNILFFDSDCVFKETVCPADYLVDGKPIIIGREFSVFKDLTDPSAKIVYNHWRTNVTRALGFEPQYETNIRVPCIFERDIFKPFREAVEKHTSMPFNDYAFSCQDKFPMGFTEFTPLGNFALRNFKDRYFFGGDTDWINDPKWGQLKADSGSLVLAVKTRQFWSHGGIKPEIKAELEMICA